MLDDFNQSNQSIAQEVYSAIDTKESVWQKDDEVNKLLKKKRHKIKHLKKKIKKGGGSKKKIKRKIRKAKKQLKKKQSAKKRKEEILKKELERVKLQNNMLRMLYLTQMPGGKEHILKQLLEDTRDDSEE